MKNSQAKTVSLSRFPDVCAQLDSDEIGWLTTVTASGLPQSSAVWFVREGDSLVVYSKPAAGKLSNLASNARIAFNLRGDEKGDSVVTMEGTAVIDEEARAPKDHADYLVKYATEIARLGWTPESFGDDYSVPLRITITRLRA